MILENTLSAKNEITAIGALAIPAVRYSFDIINWRLKEIRKTDRKTKHILTMHTMHHPKADTDRLYVKRKGRGKGLLQIEVTYKAEIINNAEYLNTKYAQDQFVNTGKSHKNNQPNMNSRIKMAAKFAELQQSNKSSNTKNEDNQHIKAKFGDSLKKKWESKVMHGQYIRSMDMQLISQEDVFLWLLRGDLKGETESEIIAAQDQALQTKYHTTKYYTWKKDSKSGLCKQFDETHRTLHSSMRNSGKRTIHKET